MPPSDEFREKRPSDQPPRRDDEDDRPPEDDDEEEERPRRRRRVRARYEDDEDDDYGEDRADDAVSTLIPYKNPKALAAYYCGVFSLIPCAGNVLGPAAFVLGILGLRYKKRDPTAKGTGHAIAGIVLGSLTILAYWVAPIAVGIAIAVSKK